MAYSITNREQLGYSAETTWGTTVGANPMLLMRYVSNSLKTTTAFTKSNEILNSREISNWIRTKVRGEGSINVEWSYGSFDDMLAGLFQATWSTNVLKVGTTFTSYTFERQFTDITQFDAYKGAVVTGITMNSQIGKPIDGAVTFQSKALVNSGTTSGTGTTAVNTNGVFEPIDYIQLIQEGGASSVAGVTGFTMKLDSANVDYEQLGSIDPATFKPGIFQATGTLDCYYQDATYLTKYLARTGTSLLFTIGGASSKKYSFLFNNVVLTSFDTANSGMNKPLIQKLGWSAAVDATDTTCQITRTP